MLTTIVRRELLGHLLSLRFALLAALTVGLMAANGLLFAGDRSAAAVSRYNDQVRQAEEALAGRAAEGLNRLAEDGPGYLYRRPGRLDFCVAGRDRTLPPSIEGGTHSSYGWGAEVFSYSWKMPWSLHYDHLETPTPANPALPVFSELDWGFIIGLVMSLMAVLLTYDAVSGERRDGTLRLALANPVPRDVLLLGKLVAAMLTAGMPLLAGMLLSLLIQSAAGSLELAGDEWLRLGLLVGLSLVYVAVFVALGLLVSTWVRRPSTGLLTLLLLWVLSVELVPGGLGILGMHLVKPLSAVEMERQSRAISDSFLDHAKAELFTRLSPSQTPDDRQVLEDWATALSRYRDAQADLQDGATDRNLERVRLARALTRVSPTAVYRYALEAIAGTGFPHYEAFVRQARQYRAAFVDFIRQEDRADPDSPHVYFVREGLSARPVDAAGVPRFADRFDLSEGLAAATWDLVLLGVLALVLFMGAYASFLRCDLTEE